MADSGSPEEDYAVIFSPGGSGSSIPPASPTDSSLGTPGDDPTGSPTTEVPTKPAGVVGKILSGPSGGSSSVDGGSDAARVTPFLKHP